MRSHRYEFVGYERWRDSAGTRRSSRRGARSARSISTPATIAGESRSASTPRSGDDDSADTGTEQYGGPIVTAGGLVFIAATMDAKFRAFDKAHWRAALGDRLPAAGYATPSTYRCGGKQYVVIAAGGGKLGTKSGDAVRRLCTP